MAAYVRELLFDLAGWTPDLKQEALFLTRCDLMSALQYLIDTNQVDRHDIMCLDKFVSGERLAELVPVYPNAYERLCKVLALLEHTSHYTDDVFLQGIVRRYPKYQKNIEIYERGLYEAGRTIE